MSYTYSACRIAFAGVLLATAFSGPGNPAGVPSHLNAQLRVCSDPNNLPFSNRLEQGFENELATLIAGDMNRTVSYFWLPQRRGFIRNTLNSTMCDVVMGVPEHYDRTLTTVPYYVSTYVWVSRRDRHLGIASFDPGKLQHLRIGLHTIGGD
jgi:mxaJ protein